MGDRVMVPSGPDWVPFADIPGPSFPMWATPLASALSWNRGVPASVPTMMPSIVARGGTWWKCRPGVVTGWMIVEASLGVAASWSSRASLEKEVGVVRALEGR